MIIDCDQHLYESRSLWQDHIDPAHRDDALAIEDDDLGYTWVTWRGEALEMADVQLPKDTQALGDHRNRRRRGEPSEYAYDDALPADYWEPAARVATVSTSSASTRRSCSRTTASSGSARLLAIAARAAPPTWRPGTAGARPCARTAVAGCTRWRT